MRILNIQITTEKPKVKEAVATQVRTTCKFTLTNGVLTIAPMGGGFPKPATTLSRSDAKTLLEFLLENRSDLQ